MVRSNRGQIVIFPVKMSWMSMTRGSSRYGAEAEIVVERLSTLW